MNLLESHPLLPLPSGEALKVDDEALKEVLLDRASQIASEKADPFRYGFRPEVWDLVDDLLVDGNKVVLDVSRIQKLYPPGFECELVDVPKEIEGCSEIWIAGSQRSTKSYYAIRKCVEVFVSKDETRGWSFADTATISRARQQPIFWHFLPYEIRQRIGVKGRWKEGVHTNVSYSGKSFGDDQLLIQNSQHWFKNYEQDITNVEGDKLDIVLFDELRDVNLLKTIRFRMGDRGGIIIAAFTSIDDNYSSIVNEYDRGSRTILEVPAELLPIKDENGNQIGTEKVPRIKVAGTGSDGDQRANIVYFHITDNPYYGWEAKKKNPEALVGKDRFYKLLQGAPRPKILSRAYGVLETSVDRQFPKFNTAIHVIEPHLVPIAGTNYHIVDPVDGRNWFMIWLRIDATGTWYVYREWPSYGHPEAYIPGAGDLGPWAVPGNMNDGAEGPAQKPIGFGLTAYKNEIERVEKDEDVFERWMDSRYGNKPTSTTEAQTTLIEMMTNIGMDFHASRASKGDSGSEIEEGRNMINELLDYDTTVPIGHFSPTFARINQPKLFISRHCPNLIFSLKEWTWKDKGKGKCKDPIDCLRYAAQAALDYIGDTCFKWRGGGSY